MDDMGKWFMEVFTSINTGGRLGPPAASNKRVRALLEEVGGEGVLKMAALLNIGNAEAVHRLASCQPDLGEQISGEEPQKALDAYFANRADVFEPYRKFMARGLSLPAGSMAVSFAHPANSGSAQSEAWEKVFQILAGRTNDGKESSNL